MNFDPSNYWIMVFTGFLLVVGSIQTWIYFKQSKLMRESIDEARKSAERQLRAYVNVSEATQVSVVLPKAGGKSCGIVIRNAGQTPAYDLIATGEFGDRPIGQEFPIPPINRKEYNGSKWVLNPGTEFILHCKWRETKYPPPPSPHGTTQYVFGRIEFRDAFGHDRYTNFCFVLAKHGHNLAPEETTFTYYHVRSDWGNEAD